MKVKLVGLLLPVYQEAHHYGATPISHRQAAVGLVEKALMDRSAGGYVTRQASLDYLSPDQAPGGAHTHKPQRLYTFAWETNSKALGEIAGIALTQYALKEITVILDGEVRKLDENDAINLVEGIDPWSAVED